MSETKDKKRVATKEILPQLTEINKCLSVIRKNVESMPKCSKKESLMTSLVNFEKKTQVAIKELSEDDVMQYVNKHPEVLQKLAQFARSDDGAKEVAQEIVTSEEIKTEAENEQKQETTPKKRRK